MLCRVFSNSINFSPTNYTTIEAFAHRIPRAPTNRIRIRTARTHAHTLRTHLITAYSRVHIVCTQTRYTLYNKRERQRTQNGWIGGGVVMVVPSSYNFNYLAHCWHAISGVFCVRTRSARLPAEPSRLHAWMHPHTHNVSAFIHVMGLRGGRLAGYVGSERVCILTDKTQHATTYECSGCVWSDSCLGGLGGLGGKIKEFMRQWHWCLCLILVQDVWIFCCFFIIKDVLILETKTIKITLKCF